MDQKYLSAISLGKQRGERELRRGQLGRAKEGKGRVLGNRAVKERGGGGKESYFLKSGFTYNELNIITVEIKNILNVSYKIYHKLRDTEIKVTDIIFV